MMILNFEITSMTRKLGITYVPQTRFLKSTSTSFFYHIVMIKAQFYTHLCM